MKDVRQGLAVWAVAVPAAFLELQLHFPHSALGREAWSLHPCVSARPLHPAGG